MLAAKQWAMKWQAEFQLELWIKNNIMNENIISGCPRIYFTGVGGQGTLTATRLLGHAALDAGLDVVAGEVHGMAQRGGVVESVLLIGGWRAPRIDKGEADIILGFEPLETMRALPFLAEGGAVFSSSDQIPPLSVSLGQEAYPDLEAIENATAKIAAVFKFLPCRQLGKEAGAIQSGNTALLGALCASKLLPFGTRELARAIETHMPEKLRSINLAAMELGAEAWLESS